MPGYILILGHPDDHHATHVYNALTEKGWDVLFWDTSSYPSQVGITLRQSGEGWLTFPDHGRVHWEQIHSVYWRCYSGAGHSPLPNQDQRTIAENDSRSLLESFLALAPGGRWVNPWSAYSWHQKKPAALAKVAALPLPTNLRLPATIQTNDPEAILEFASHHERSIFKPVQGGAHTQRLEKRHLEQERLSHLALAPVTLQEEVRGTDVRVFVARDRVLSCELQTESLDFRDDPDPKIVPHELPDAVSESCRKIARELELVWTGIDLRRTPDGCYYYFEANPSPMFLGFQERSGLPLGKELIRLLVE